MSDYMKSLELMIEREESVYFPAMAAGWKRQENSPER